MVCGACGIYKAVIICNNPKRERELIRDIPKEMFEKKQLVLVID
jgi:hypothetical protein